MKRPNLNTAVLTLASSYFKKLLNRTRISLRTTDNVHPQSNAQRGPQKLLPTAPHTIIIIIIVIGAWCGSVVGDWSQYSEIKHGPSSLVPGWVTTRVFNNESSRHIQVFLDQPYRPLPPLKKC